MYMTSCSSHFELYELSLFACCICTLGFLKPWKPMVFDRYSLVTFSTLFLGFRSPFPRVRHERDANERCRQILGEEDW